MGYGLGLGSMLLWRFLELPEFRGKLLAQIQLTAGLITFSVVLYFYTYATIWQNSVRSLMNMEPTTGVALVIVTILALLIWLVFIYTAYFVRFLYIAAAVKVHTFVPRRISYVIGGLLLTIFLILTINGFLITKAIDIADDTYAVIDQAIPYGIIPPEKSTRSGSDGSLINWNDLGREGKYFVAGGLSKEKIEFVTGKKALDPIRVYVGLSAADTPKKQAALALAELKRTNAFLRSKLVIATPTGTGWVDEGAVDSFEYLYAGDTAFVGVQYSYLSSPITLILDPDRVRISAQAVFSEIYNYWRSLDKETRPELFIYGLSLGSLGSEDSANIFSLLSDPIAGALWVGPPFANKFWPQVMAGRNRGSSAFLPLFDKGELVRILNSSEDIPIEPTLNWGPLKIVYLLHPSDAIVFFSFDLWFKEPDWLAKERGPDVSPYLTWYPFVTMWQIGLDMLATSNVPYGHGHNYAPTDYLRAWVELAENPTWSKEELENIKTTLGTGATNR